MDNEKLRKLRSLIDEVIYSHNKKEAAIPLRKLEFMAAQVKSELNGYSSGKLSEAVGYAKEASGQVKNRDLCISNMERSWYVFESDVLNGNSGINGVSDT
jgi:hypothetical protein